MEDPEDPPYRLGRFLEVQFKDSQYCRSSSHPNRRLRRYLGVQFEDSALALYHSSYFIRLEEDL